MNHTETERKWIVNLDQLMEEHESGKVRFTSTYEFFQGYVDVDNPKSTVRYRINETLKRAYHTFKYHIQAGEATEIEVEIPYPDGKAFINHCDYVLHKKRRLIPFSGQIFEVDFFDDGLVLAELEIPNMEVEVIVPEWCETEVTGDKKYSNFNLSKTNTLVK